MCGRLCRTVRGSGHDSSDSPDSPDSPGPGNTDIFSRLGSPDSPYNPGYSGRFGSLGPGNPGSLSRLGSPDSPDSPDSPYNPGCSGRLGCPGSGNPDRLDPDNFGSLTSPDRIRNPDNPDNFGSLTSPDGIRNPDNPDSHGNQPSRPENSARPPMNIDLLTIGKTDSPEVAALVAEYARRINFYCRFTVTMLPDVKRTRSLAPRQQCVLEGEALLRQIAPGDCLTLLDERGAEYRSVELAGWLQKRMLGGTRRLVLAVGGPYGFSDAVYARADARLSLSKLTFSHQIVRVLLAEQLYRAFTILNNEPYHHE